MTKKFITHCFIRKNTPELKAKLEKVGILLNPLTKNHNEEIGLVAYDGTYFTIREENILDNVTNCGENEALFLALAAMNDSDDKDQLCIVNAPIFMFNKLKGIVEPENKQKYQVKGNFFKCLVPSKGSIKGQFIGYANPIIRKATAPEIIEHFKTKEK